MLKFGFEREYFVTVDDPESGDLTEYGKLVLPPPGTPRDGVLAEARGKPSKCPVKAAYSLLAEEHRVRIALPPNHHLEANTAVLKVSRELRIESARTETKGLVHYQNLYGHKRHRHKQSEMTAGLYVSVTRGQSITTHRGRQCSECGHSDHVEREVNIMFDFAQFIRAMDAEYADIIKATSRRPGFYEIKHDGRVEYRSLPTSVDIVEVADFLKSKIHAIHGSW